MYKQSKQKVKKQYNRVEVGETYDGDRGGKFETRRFSENIIKPTSLYQTDRKRGYKLLVSEMTQDITYRHQKDSKRTPGRTPPTNLTTTQSPQITATQPYETDDLKSPKIIKETESVV